MDKMNTFHTREKGSVYEPSHETYTNCILTVYGYMVSCTNDIRHRKPFVYILTVSVIYTRTVYTIPYIVRTKTVQSYTVRIRFVYGLYMFCITVRTWTFFHR